MPLGNACADARLSRHGCTKVPDGWASTSGVASETPVPVAPVVPTVVTSIGPSWAAPESMTIDMPTNIPPTLASLMFVAPEATAAASTVPVKQPRLAELFL